jgi:hypothetical protein
MSASACCRKKVVPVAGRSWCLLQEGASRKEQLAPVAGRVSLAPVEAGACCRKSQLGAC